MPDDQLIQFIQKSLADGSNEEDIRKNLLKAYWVPEEIDQAFEIIKKLQQTEPLKKVSANKRFFLKIGRFGTKTKNIIIRPKKPLYGIDAYLGKKPCFGLDISDYSLEAVQLTAKRGIIKLTGLGRVIIKPNIIKDGLITQKEELSKSILDLLSSIKFGTIRTNDVVCSLPESQIFSHIFKFPASLKADQIKEALKFEAEGVIPVPLSEVNYDLSIISHQEKEDIAKEQEVLFVAAKKTVINDYLEVLNGAGLNVLAMENEALSLSRSLFKASSVIEKNIPAGVPMPLRGVMIIDLGARTTNLSIIDRNGLRLAVNLYIAGNNFSENLAHNLGLPYLEADRLKREYGLSKDFNDGRLYQTLAPMISEICEEIKKAITYYEQEKDGQITKILLAGGTAQMPGLIDYFHQNLSDPINQNRSLAKKIEIKVGNPWIGIELDEKLAQPHFEEKTGDVLDNVRTALSRRSILYATAIGVSLRAITKDPVKTGINLLPKK